MSLFSCPDGDIENGWISSINPLLWVDVMLVLLIIFLVIIGALSISIDRNFSGKSALMQSAGGDSVVISVDKAGNLYLNNTFAPDIQALSSLMQGIASRTPQPELHIRADADVQYAYVGQIIDTAQGHGFLQVHLITGPAQK